ncbi:MAG TPA: hypothetical protein EYQ08_09500 [Planctomycetes bacterium]|nr:hypothetical protein [Planctomycetota bacterium]
MSEDTTKGQVDSAKKPDGKTSAAKVKKKPRKPKPMPDVARMYIEHQTRDQTPMVFVTRDGELRATVVQGGMYEHVLNVDGEPTTVKKVTLEYHYKQIDADTVAEKVAHDPSIDTENPRRQGRRLSNKDLWVSRQQWIPVRLTLRAAAQFTGLIEWFTPYAIKLNIGLRGEDGTASVILHRHAIVRLELLAEPKEERPSDQKSQKD